MLKKMTENILVISAIALILWMGVSYLEIICKNLDDNPQYSKHNIIVNVTEEVHERYYGGSEK